LASAAKNNSYHITEEDEASFQSPSQSQSQSQSRRGSVEKQDKGEKMYGTRDKRASTTITPDSNPNEALLAYVETVSRNLAKDGIENSQDGSTGLYKKRYLLDDEVLTASTNRLIATRKCDSNGTGSTGAGAGTNTNDANSLPHSSQSIPQSSLISVNASDWPGQSEGEAMDLEHFWNIASMSCPEDHPVQWVDSTLDPVLTYLNSIRDPLCNGGGVKGVRDKDVTGIAGAVVDTDMDKDMDRDVDVHARGKGSKPRSRLNQPPSKSNPNPNPQSEPINYYALPSVDPTLVPNAHLFDTLGELITSIGSTRGLSHIFDLDRRLDFQTKSIELANQMTDGLNSGTNGSTNGTNDGNNPSKPLTVLQDEIDFVTKYSDCFDYNDNTSDNTSGNTSTSGNRHIRVAIDSEPNRVICEYEVEMNGDNGHDCVRNTRNTTIPMLYADTTVLSANTIYKELHNSNNNLDNTDNNNNNSNGNNTAKVSLVSFETIDDCSDIAMVDILTNGNNECNTDKVVVSTLYSREDDDLICRMLRSDQHSSVSI